MTDIIDTASELEERHRAASLAAQQARARRADAATAPAGHRDCCDCGLPIPGERLAARPLALRCVSCQALAERY